MSAKKEWLGVVGECGSRMTSGGAIAVFQKGVILGWYSLGVI